MSKKEFGIRFGALCDPVEEQLASQGLETTPENIKKFNDLNNARLTLLFGNCITDSINDKICKKKL